MNILINKLLKYGFVALYLAAWRAIVLHEELSCIFHEGYYILPGELCSCMWLCGKRKMVTKHIKTESKENEKHIITKLHWITIYDFSLGTNSLLKCESLPLIGLQFTTDVFWSESNSSFICYERNLPMIHEVWVHTTLILFSFQLHINPFYIMVMTTEFIRLRFEFLLKPKPLISGEVILDEALTQREGSWKLYRIFIEFYKITKG